MLIKCQTLRRSAIAGCALLSLCCIPVASHAQDQTPATTTTPDNSGDNKTQNQTMHKGMHHKSAHHQTADQQPENTSDREITRKIRRSLVSDKSLSTYGHNVKIITQNGAVTLKGPVHSEEEKKSIASKAAEVAGQDKVTDQLTVKQ